MDAGVETESDRENPTAVWGPKLTPSKVRQKGPRILQANGGQARRSEEMDQTSGPRSFVESQKFSGPVDVCQVKGQQPHSGFSCSNMCKKIGVEVGLMQLTLQQLDEQRLLRVRVRRDVGWAGRDGATRCADSLSPSRTR